jgi:hypothetical protein
LTAALLVFVDGEGAAGNLMLRLFTDTLPLPHNYASDEGCPASAVTAIVAAESFP